MGKKVDKKWKSRAENRRRTIEKITRADMDDTVQVSLDNTCPVFVKVVGKQDCKTGGIETTETEKDCETKLSIKDTEIQELNAEKNRILSSHIPEEKVRELLDQIFEKYETLLESYNKSIAETKNCQRIYDTTFEDLKLCSKSHLKDVKKFHKLLQAKHKDVTEEEHEAQLKKEEALLLHASLRKGKWKFRLLIILLCLLIIMIAVRLIMARSTF